MLVDAVNLNYCFASLLKDFFNLAAYCLLLSKEHAPTERTSSDSASRLCLEPESGLITHGDAVEHVTRWGSVSLGASMITANGCVLRIGIETGDARFHSPRRSPAPICLTDFESDASSLWLLINLQRDDSGTSQYCRNGSQHEANEGTSSRDMNVWSAFQTDAPQRLAKQFIALPPMKFVEEIIEITRRRLLDASIEAASRFRCRQILPFSAQIKKRGFSEIRPGNFATAGSRKRAWNVLSLPRHARFYLFPRGACLEYGTW